MNAASALCVLLALAGCVSDAPTGTDAGGDSATNDTGAGDGATNDTGTNNDAADGGCKAPTVQCGASCVLFDSDPKNCGMCGHACSSNACSGGHCSAYFVFVAGGASNGTLSGNLGGLAGGDAKCRQEAMAANLPGEFMAWLSVGSTSPAGRFTHATSPYELVDTTIVANNWADLTDGTLSHVIDEDAKGIALTNGAHSVMTDTKPDGTPGGQADCSGWMTTSGNHAQGGATNTAASGWTEGGYQTASCSDATFNLYCFEQ